ncbi:hypothetical protein [Nannocystis pusilla]|uniref:hypothetical protein n=1 Tax=Nannocystis pusilla TaxID=889268 RepID=UPI003B81C3B9
MTSITGPAFAAEPLEVTVPTRVLGAIVAAEGGAAVVVKVDAALGPADIRVAGAVHSVAASQRDLLDDPRNAPRVGAGVRKILSAARPDLAATFEANHKAWTMTFVRKVLAWNARLAASPVRGKRIINPWIAPPCSRGRGPSSTPRDSRRRRLSRERRRTRPRPRSRATSHMSKRSCAASSDLRTRASTWRT